LSFAEPPFAEWNRSLDARRPAKPRDKKVVYLIAAPKFLDPTAHVFHRIIELSNATKIAGDTDCYALVCS
jgi:hypothetical protein